MSRCGDCSWKVNREKFHPINPQSFLRCRKHGGIKLFDNDPACPDFKYDEVAVANTVWDEV